MQRIDRLLKPLFWIAVVFAFVCATMPAADVPTVGNDKVQHAATFAFLAAFASVAWRTSAWWRIALPLAVFGALIEFAQMVPFVHRDAELGDWIADVAGIMLGIAIGRLLRPRAHRILAGGAV